MSAPKAAAARAEATENDRFRRDVRLRDAAGREVLSVGRDREDPEIGASVRLDVFGQTIFLGPRNTLAVAQALMAVADELLLEEGSCTHPGPERPQ
jgi:hypothetical protein